MAAEPIGDTKFQIFRFDGAATLAETGKMHVKDATEGIKAQSARLYGAGYADGFQVLTLFDAPGFSLTYSWFKRGFPLPLHKHDVDCLYYVVAGSLKIGTQVLGRGDGVFVPRNVPYTFESGDDGVEFLEFRHQGSFDFRFIAKEMSPFWDKAVAQVKANASDWQDAVPPHLIAARGM